MGKFIYGTGSTAFKVDLSDRFLELLETVLAEAYSLQEPFSISYVGQSDRRLLFVTDGVPIQIEYSSSEIGDPTTEERKVLDAMRRGLAKTRTIVILAPRPRTTIHTGTSTRR